MIKARKKTQRTDTESLGLQHESRRGSSGARLGTRGTWVSSLPSGVGSYANEGKKPTPTLKNKKIKTNARELCQRDRSTESTNEDIVGLCLARESLRRRDGRGHQRSARAFEVVWASWFFVRRFSFAKKKKETRGRRTARASTQLATADAPRASTRREPPWPHRRFTRT